MTHRERKLDALKTDPVQIMFDKLYAIMNQKFEIERDRIRKLAIKLNIFSNIDVDKLKEIDTFTKELNKYRQKQQNLEEKYA